MTKRPYGTQVNEDDESEDLLAMQIPERPAATMSTDPKAPRLVITKIVVENFKSYFGKQTLGPFHKVGFISWQHLNNLFRTSLRFWDRMAVEKVMSLILCCLCSAFVQTRSAPRRSVF
jgi:hypothetical protein